jgi:hypothetical protein
MRSASTPAHGVIPACVLSWHVADEACRAVVEHLDFFSDRDSRSRAISSDRAALVGASQLANDNDFMSAILLQQMGRAYCAVLVARR